MVHDTRSKEEKKVSYLKEMLFHPASTYGGLAALGVGALLSLPFGLGVGLLPVLAYAAAEGIAAVFVPSDPRFREKVDKRHRAELREQSREHLISEIQSRVGDEGGRNWQTYKRMRERLESLSTVARRRKTQLSQRDVEGLDDASLKYLGLWLAKLVMVERRAAVNERELGQRIADIDRQLDKTERRPEKIRLEKARDELERILKGRDSLRARESAVDAAMISMADSFEEVYQQIVTNPTSQDVTQHLLEAANRMRVEEGLDLAVEEEIGELFRTPRARDTERVKSS